MVRAFQQDAFQNDAFQVGFDAHATEAVSTSDQPSKHLVLHRSASDAVTTADAATVPDDLTAFQRDAFQNDAFQIANVAPTRSTADAVSTADTATRTVALHRTAADAPHTSDVATVGTHNRNASDSISTADSATRAGQFHRSASDAVTTADVATRPVSGGERFIVVVIG